MSKVIGLLYTHSLQLHSTVVHDLHTLVIGTPGCAHTQHTHINTALRDLLHAAYLRTSHTWPAVVVLLARAAPHTPVQLQHTDGCGRLLACVLHALATCSSPPAPCLLPCHALTTRLVTCLCDLAACGVPHVQAAALSLLCSHMQRQPHGVPLPQVLLVLRAVRGSVANAAMGSEGVDGVLHVAVAARVIDVLQSHEASSGVSVAARSLVEYLVSLLPLCQADAVLSTLTQAYSLPVWGAVETAVPVVRWWRQCPPHDAELAAAVVTCLHAAAQCSNQHSGESSGRDSSCADEPAAKRARSGVTDTDAASQTHALGACLQQLKPDAGGADRLMQVGAARNATRQATYARPLGSGGNDGACVLRGARGAGCGDRRGGCLGRVVARRRPAPTAPPPHHIAHARYAPFHLKS